MLYLALAIVLLVLILGWIFWPVFFGNTEGSGDYTSGDGSTLPPGRTDAQNDAIDQQGIEGLKRRGIDDYGYPFGSIIDPESGLPVIRIK